MVWDGPGLGREGYCATSLELGPLSAPPCSISELVKKLQCKNSKLESDLPDHYEGNFDMVRG